MLHMQDGYPHLTVKAWNGQVLLVFLDRCLTALVAAGAQDQEIQPAYLATRAMTCWFDRLARFPRLLSQAQGKDFDFCASTGSWRRVGKAEVDMEVDAEVVEKEEDEEEEEKNNCDKI